ncbi:MAG: exonuclease SbcCD subunit D [Acetatifactor sp.]
MKFLHTADLHIGKKIFEQSLLEDQKYILDRIYEVAVEERVDAVVIAGDVYDRAVPSAEAVALLDDFLTRLVSKKIPVLLISGNHDSAERVSFAERILEGQGLYIAGTYREPPRTVVLEDEYGPVSFVLLPFVKSAVVGEESAAQAMEYMLAHTPITWNANNRAVLITHFFVTGTDGEQPELSDSEDTSSVGGLDSVPSSLFANFSYVALGHIHKPQHMGGGRIYYAGSPLKYSFSEWRTPKSVNIVELGTEKRPVVRRVPLKPLHDMRCIRGKLEELIAAETVEENRSGAGACSGIEDYLQVTLTDTEELVDPIGTLRSVYPNVLQIVLEKNQRASGEEYESRLIGKRKGIEELFSDFYELLQGEPMDEKRREIVHEVAKTVKERQV